MNASSQIKESSEMTKDMVKDYYGQVLKTKEDLKTSACCEGSSFPNHLKEIIGKIEPEILDKFYGCGSPLPIGLEGCRVLDLGCGTGRDCYLSSALVGDTGEVVGIDMTDEQLEIANRYKTKQMENFGQNKSNVTFKKGYIEDLQSAGLEDNSFDVVISNCVINLSPRKDQVLSEVYRVLKPGGEFYFSDVYADRRLPKECREDKVLLGECLGGALYYKDFLRLARRVGFNEPRVFHTRPLDIHSKDVIEKVGLANFSSTLYRLFKNDELEDDCEDYGHKIKYLGTIPEEPNKFMLDKNHIFIKNRNYSVCGNTYKMLFDTRFKDHFAFSGDFSTHMGTFDCAQVSPDAKGEAENCSAPGCC